MRAVAAAEAQLNSVEHGASVYLPMEGAATLPFRHPAAAVRRAAPDAAARAHRHHSDRRRLRRAESGRRP
ncbi:hypothetical protein M8494_29215 [Serratia ureilytica]